MRQMTTLKLLHGLNMMERHADMHLPDDAVQCILGQAAGSSWRNAILILTQLPLPSDITPG